MQDEVAHLVVPYRRQECWPQAQAPRTDTDIRRATADVGSKAGNLLERRSDVVGVEIDGRSSHSDQVVEFANRFHTRLLFSSDAGFHLVKRHTRITRLVVMFDPGMIGVLAVGKRLSTAGQNVEIVGGVTRRTAYWVIALWYEYDIIVPR